MDTTDVISALNELLPDDKIFGDVIAHLEYFSKDGNTTIHVDSKPRIVPTSIQVSIIKKVFSLAYLSNEQSVINVLLAVNFDPMTLDWKQFDPEQHCFGIMQYGDQRGELLVLAFQTEYWYC